LSKESVNGDASSGSDSEGETILSNPERAMEKTTLQLIDKTVAKTQEKVAMRHTKAGKKAIRNIDRLVKEGETCKYIIDENHISKKPHRCPNKWSRCQFTGELRQYCSRHVYAMKEQAKKKERKQNNNNDNNGGNSQNALLQAFSTLLAQVQAATSINVGQAPAPQAPTRPTIVLPTGMEGMTATTPVQPIGNQAAEKTTEEMAFVFPSVPKSKPVLSRDERLFNKLRELGKLNVKDQNELNALEVQAAKSLSIQSTPVVPPIPPVNPIPVPPTPGVAASPTPEMVHVGIPNWAQDSEGKILPEMQLVLKQLYDAWFTAGKKVPFVDFADHYYFEAKTKEASPS